MPYILATTNVLTSFHRHLPQRRKQALDESYFLHRFLADFRDLVSWIHDMKAIVSADELAKDVAGAEALLERHQEHKVGSGMGRARAGFVLTGRCFGVHYCNSSPTVVIPSRSVKVL